MTTLASDNFNRADGALGANWTALDAGMSILTNEVTTATAPSSARYTGVAFPNDQWAQVKIGTVNETATDQGPGPIVRGQAGGDIIFLQCNAIETKIYERISGVYTQKGPNGAVVAAGDTVYLEIQGTTLIAKKNGSTIITATASGTIASGSAGMWGSPSGVNKLDDFTAGDFTVAASNTLMGQASL